MDEKELQAMKESNATLQNKLAAMELENARIKEAQALRVARDVVEAVLSKQQLPDATRARLLESLPNSAPMKDGVLDQDAFNAKIAEAVKAESAYLESVMGSGKIRGLGGNGNGGGEEFDEAKVNDQLASAFSAMGLSESATKIAAAGRI